MSFTARHVEMPPSPEEASAQPEGEGGGESLPPDEPVEEGSEAEPPDPGADSPEGGLS